MRMKIDFLWASCFVQTQSGFRVSSTQYTLSSEVDLIVVAMTIIIIIIIYKLFVRSCYRVREKGSIQ